METQHANQNGQGQQKSPKEVRILVIHGGGLFGVLPATILAEIEKRMGKPVHDLFHMVAGTSTGGVLAAGLARPGSPLSAEKMRGLYLKEASEIFEKSMFRSIPGVKTVHDLVAPKYSNTGLKRALRKYLGESRLSDITAMDVMMTGYLTNPRDEIIEDGEIRKENHAHFMKSWKAQGRRLRRRDGETKESRDFLITDAALATSAAPTYFPPVTIKNGEGRVMSFVDGALVANNPIDEAIESARRLYPDAEKYTVVSIGTREHDLTINAEDARGWGQIKWAPKALDILLNGSSELANARAATRLEQIGGGSKLFTFNAPLDLGNGSNEIPSENMDDASKSNLKRLDTWSRRAATEYLSDEIDELCAVLGEQEKTPRKDLGYCDERNPNELTPRGKALQAAEHHRRRKDKKRNLQISRRGFSPSDTRPS